MCSLTAIKMIDQSTIDRIINTAQIVDVVEDFVSLRKRGVNFIGLCPFHDEKTPSFTVSPAKNICKCFGCGKGGSPVNFIMEHEHMSFHDALRYLAKKYNIEIVEKEVSQEELQKRNDRDSMFILNGFAQNYFSEILWKDDEGRSVGMSYFKERGFQDDIIRKFGLGYSLEKYNALADTAQSKGYKKEFLLKTGLCAERGDGKIADRFRGRVMFPVHSISGKIVAFGGRILKTDEKTAKYVNSPESEIYHKSNELYGIYFAKQSIVKNDCCFLVEGYTDVLSMFQAGIENVVASSGTALTPPQIRLIHRFTSNITVLYDGDAAGIKASIRGIDLLLEEGINVKVVLLPNGEDPDSFAKQQNAVDFIEYINKHQTDFIHFKSQLLLEEAGKDVAKKAHLISDIVQSIAIIPDNIMRSVYIKECAKRFEIGEDVLIAEVNKIRRTSSLKKELKTQTSDYQEYSNSQVSYEAPKTESAVLAKEEKPFAYLQEQNILRCIIRYGKQTLQIQDENGSPITMSVFDFIANDMVADNVSLEYPLHKKIIEEIKVIISDENNDMEHYFLNHPDSEIRKYVFDITTEKYTLSSIHKKYKQFENEGDRLEILIPKILVEYKDKVITHYYDELTKKIKDAQNEGDEETITKLLKQQTELNQIRQILAKHSGERTVLKI